MAAKDEIVVGAKGQIWLADYASDAPTTADPTDLAEAWEDLGVVTGEGVTFSDERTMSDIDQWAGFYPVRKLVTARDTKVSFRLRQWNEENLAFALGGGSFDGDGTYTPPAASEVAEHALSVSWKDGENMFLLYISRGVVSSNVNFNLVRNENAALPIEFTVLGEAEGDEDNPYTLFTDALGFAAVS